MKTKTEAYFPAQYNVKMLSSSIRSINDENLANTSVMNKKMANIAIQDYKNSEHVRIQQYLRTDAYSTIKRPS